MRDATRQLTDGFHLLCLHQACFGFLALRDLGGEPIICGGQFSRAFRDLLLQCLRELAQRLLSSIAFGQVFRTESLPIPSPDCGAGRAYERGRVKGPFKDRDVHFRLDLFRCLAVTAATNEEQEREVGPGRLICYRLDEPAAVHSIQRIISYHRASGQSLGESGKQKLAIAIHDRLKASALQQLLNHLRIPAGGRDDEETLHIRT
jgi:hypothetical protein